MYYYDDEKFYKCQLIQIYHYNIYIYKLEDSSYIFLSVDSYKIYDGNTDEEKQQFIEDYKICKEIEEELFKKENFNRHILYDSGEKKQLSEYEIIFIEIDWKEINKKIPIIQLKSKNIHNLIFYEFPTDNKYIKFNENQILDKYNIQKFIEENEDKKLSVKDVKNKTLNPFLITENAVPLLTECNIFINADDISSIMLMCLIVLPFYLSVSSIKNINLIEYYNQHKKNYYKLKINSDEIYNIKIYNASYAELIFIKNGLPENDIIFNSFVEQDYRTFDFTYENSLLTYLLFDYEIILYTDGDILEYTFTYFDVSLLNCIKKTTYTLSNLGINYIIKNGLINIINSDVELQ